MAYRLSLPELQQSGARLALALLCAVFVLKAALLPLSFWLPHTYAAAPAPVAALFAIMTKVGIVSLLRLQVIAIEPAYPDLLYGWLTTLALATVLFAVLGALAAKDMKTLSAWLVLLSAGTLLLVPAQASAEISAAGLFYLAHSSFAGAACFLLAELIGEQRGAAGHTFSTGANRLPVWSGIAFIVLAMTLAGLPPFSGFLGKLMLLNTLRGVEAGVAIWTILLLAAFLVMMALARAGSILIWENGPGETPSPARPAAASGWRRLGATLCLIAAGPLLAVFAQPRVRLCPTHCNTASRHPRLHPRRSWKRSGDDSARKKGVGRHAEKTSPPRHQDHQVSPRKAISIAFLGGSSVLGVLVVKHLNLSPNQPPCSNN